MSFRGSKLSRGVHFSLRGCVGIGFLSKQEASAKRKKWLIRPLFLCFSLFCGEVFYENPPLYVKNMLKPEGFSKLGFLVDTK